MITLKSEREIKKMREAGLLVWHAHQIGEKLARVGMTTGEIDAKMERFFLDHNAQPLFKGVLGTVPFPATCCMSINEEVVHGIPGKRILQEGDILSIDTGCRFDGWCGDSARTHGIGIIDSIARRLLDVTQGALDVAIRSIRVGIYWSDVARNIEEYVAPSGFSIVESLVGHGIGKELHEDPQVPNYVCSELHRLGGDFKLQPGLVIAVEPMINVGSKRVAIQRDHWTMSTVDKKISAHFEHTIAVTTYGVQVLTGPPTTEDEKFDIQRYIG